ncbi:putative baseplate assembly protein [Andreprevotia lacus DSM 23236]|jgi:hypothetical protein|uniref:Putative baseplate assembly protein n=1 Tax=Andreprevotia lacus DSM 23236 TaxID=1121001 RepID=A0A1W1X799_9NEIS|nr:putative baseplate assembly protein [Andreprevotia lacus]SMC19694.1 putative baseplate assembly protein [Andreprevotia lacus DSM 23236]
MSLPDRIELLRQSSALSGIDFIYVAPTQDELQVYFVHDKLPAAVKTALTGLAPDQFSITGEGQVTPAHVAVLTSSMVQVNGRDALKLTLSGPGGFGYYRLAINSAKLDGYYNRVRFSFKAACASQLDCETGPHACPPEAQIDFPVDYSARDFWSLRQALFDFAAQRYPDWQDRLEADLGVVMVELLSALGDEFSYAQDRILRETTLETASQRRSLRQLARLVDYPLDNGSGAFAWLAISANSIGKVKGGTVVTDPAQQIAFEVGHGLADYNVDFPVDPALNQLAPHLWDENDSCLPAGSTQLTLAGHLQALLAPWVATDPVGKWIALLTRPTDPSKPARQLAVRVASATDGSDVLLAQDITTIVWDVPTPFELDLETLVVLGNLLPATSGRTLPARSEPALRFRIGAPAGPADPNADLPQALERIGINEALDYAAVHTRIKHLFSLPGSDVVPLAWYADDDGASVPEVEVVREGHGPWHWRDALIGEETALPTDPVYVLEDGLYRTVFSAERFGKVTALSDYASSEGMTLRFGDGEFGQQAPQGAVFAVRYRLGNGRLMNVSAGTLVRFDSQPAFVDAVTNPLPASGGRDPESAEQIRINAPQAFRTVTERAVRPEDYADIAQRLPWVQRAGAVQRWTGSWPTVMVTPDVRDSYGASAGQQAELTALLDRVRQAGREVRQRQPRYASFDLEIVVCVLPRAYRGEVKAAVLQALFGSDGMSGFFDPDHFTFGTPLSRAALLAAIQAVPGVKAVEDMQVRRRGWFGWRAFNEFSLSVAPDEIVRVTNDRDLPERGAVKLVMEGGL